MERSLTVSGPVGFASWLSGFRDPGACAIGSRWPTSGSRYAGRCSACLLIVPRWGRRCYLPHGGGEGRRSGGGVPRHDYTRQNESNFPSLKNRTRQPLLTARPPAARPPSRAGAGRAADPARRASLPGPETAVFCVYAPRAPIQKPHTKWIYIGKREGRSNAPGRPGPGRKMRPCAMPKSEMPKNILKKTRKT